MPLLERGALLAALRAHEDAVRVGHGRLVVVAGEAGAGKTSLVQAAFPDAVWGYCEPLSTPRPLGPFRDLAAQLICSVPARRNALADRLLGLLGSSGVVWVVEDAHWLDTGSAQVLRFLGRRIATTHALLLVVVRDDQPADGALSEALGELPDVLARIEVPALTRAEAGVLAADSGLDVDEVMQLTDGNAFLVAQLAGMPDGRPAAPVRDAVTVRLARVGVPARQLAQLLSVLPGRIPAEVVNDWRAADELVAAGMLVVDGSTVRFRHELLRLAVEDGIPPGRRRELHGVVLGRLGPAAEPTQVAYHARQADRMDIALPSEIAAAVRAAALGSHHEAAAHYRRAVDDSRLGAAPAEQVRLLVRLAEQERSVAHDAAARLAADEAVVLAASVGDPLLRSTAVLMQSRLDPSEAGADELAHAAVDMCEPEGPSTELAAAYAALANHRMVARDLTDAVRLADRAVTLARQLGDVGTEVVAANAWGCALLLGGDPSGEALLRRAIHLAAAAALDPEVGRAYANLVSAAGEARMYDLSAAAGREAFRYFTSRDLDAWAAYTRAWTARCLFEQGRWADADAELGVLQSNTHSTTAITDLLTSYLTVRLSVRRGSGVPATALALARALAEKTGSLQRVAPVVAARAEADWHAARPLDTVLLHGVYRTAFARQNSWTIGEIGFWLWRAGELTELPASAAAPFRLHVAGAYNKAADAWSALGCRYEAADALADTADEGDLRAALDVFSSLGAQPARRRVIRRLSELGVRSLPRGPRPTSAADPSGLTAREREVLDLLARGRTDREIAATMYLSVRTVGHHVSAILRKKGVGNRRELRGEPHCDPC